MTTTTTPDRLLTVREASEYLSVSQRTLFSRSAPRGPIPVIRVTAWAVRYDRADLDAYIATQRQAVGNE